MQQPADIPFEVNGHIHTPYSFSAFENMEQAFRMANDEGIKALGINDFNTFEGYDEFDRMSRKYRIFPLFNVEFMGLLEQEQKNGIRINDPANPGRIYFSGKGMDYPVRLSEKKEQQFRQTFEESNRQTRTMLHKASQLLTTLDPDLHLDHQLVMSVLTKGMLRERHIAKAIRLAVFEKYSSENERKAFLSRLFEGKQVKSSISDEAGIDNEIRGNLLKAGGAAFVKENPKAFLSLDDIISIITDGGGIPCYPVLLDDSQGNYTEYEADPEKLFIQLQSRNVCCIELIPGRNDLQALRSFVEFFERKGFVITFGTEHNSPKMAPLTLTTRGNTPLDHYLKKVNFEGACLQAAHQQLRANGEPGLTCTAFFEGAKRKEYIEMGNRIIQSFCQTQ